MSVGRESFVGRVERVNLEMGHLELVRSPVPPLLRRELREHIGAE